MIEIPAVLKQVGSTIDPFAILPLNGILFN
jgi:hypothetical protein